MFGGKTPEGPPNIDGSNNLREAKAINWIYELGNTHSDEFYMEFETKMEDFAQEFSNSSPLIEVYWYTFSSIENNSNLAMKEDEMLFKIGIIIVLVYVLVSVGRLHTQSSRLLIGVAGLGCIGIAFVEAIGFGSFLGWPGSQVSQILPFVMLGIGIDDMFVLVHILNQAPEGYSGRDKFIYMMQVAGTSITLTSLTNMVSFGIGSITSLPAMSGFCKYASLGMFFDYFNQITLFSALLVYDIQRSEKDQGDCCNLLSCKPKSRESCFARAVLDQNDNIREPLTKTVFREYYAPMLLSRWGKAFVLLATLGFQLFNIIEASKLEYKFDFEWFVDDSFYLHRTIEVRDEYFPAAPRSVRMYTFDTDFAA